MITSLAQSVLSQLHASSRERATIFKAVSFGLIGFVNTAVDLIIFALGYYLLGLPIILANLFSWSFAVSTSYVLNSTITFSIDSPRRLSLKTYASFVGAQLAGFAANTITVVVASHFIPMLSAKILATGASFFVNFSFLHFVVFRRQPADAFESK